ncbi:MAG TPA: type I-U CRISPR-associated protein Csb2 [Bryobacteraceae bacterium]|nr:type I-U CRISPR-associated protein Csb2 [Bryobacteraceae bacterium]
MLVIEVEYLLGRVYAAASRDGAEPEWPPSPARLFSALVAAYHDSNGIEPEHEALLWLEQQPPPRIAAKQAGRPDAVVTFVPTNYSGKSGSTHPEQRGKQARSFPAQAPESPVVYFVWPDNEAPIQHVEALSQLTTRVASLGRACSLVRVRLLDAEEALLFQPNYVPDEDGQEVFTVAGTGRLEELERTYEAARRPSQGALTRYRNTEHTERPRQPRQGHFGEMVVLRRIGGIGFPVEAAPMLTKRLRDAFLSRAGEGKPLSGMLSGHDGDKPVSGPHVAFAALPNAGYDHSDGRLMGVAVILPVSIGGTDRRTALRACSSIESINLGEQLGEWQVEIANFDVMQTTLKTDTWMRANRHWQTVTPILLDRYPKKHLSADELLMTACLRAGLPAPVRCTYGKYSELKGVPPVSAFAPSRWAVHATFEFEAPVRGPVLVGAGRFFGMGLMKPGRTPQWEMEAQG